MRRRDFLGKCQEILMELMPNARRMAAVYDAALEFPGQLDEFKNELAINLKVAAQLGIAVSPAVQLRADEVIE